MKNMYQDIHKNDVDIQSYNILIVTATDTETEAFHEVMEGTISRVASGDYSYYLGIVGQYKVVHVQCQQMGSISPGGSLQTINDALHEWSQIKAVIMVGICFGVDPEKQNIGDVIVATSIKNYETRRMGKDQEIPRGETYQSDRCLQNAFKTLRLTWENIGIDDAEKALELGAYISGEQLVDNKTVRSKLLSETPEAKGGEMEGNGMVAACVSARIPWILVKAICDFADGNKGKDKKKRQRIAAVSSARCCQAALGQATTFESIGIFTVANKEQQQIMETRNEDNIDVLFELYKEEFAPYYVQREVDRSVESYLSSHSLWVYGISGVGKSTAITHALLSMKKNILLVNMAGIRPNCELEDIFVWIYNEISNIVGESAVPSASYQLCIRQIISLLDNHFADQQVYILVEEIPFTGEVFSSFVSSFSSLVVSDKLTGKSADVHFVLSSIENPLPHVPDYLQKIKSFIKFLEFNVWTDEECSELIDLISGNLTVPCVKDRQGLISQCGNLPRPIKTLFRETYQTKKYKELDNQSVKAILSRY